MKVPLPSGGRPANRAPKNFPAPAQQLGKRTFKRPAAKPKDARPGGRYSNSRDSR